MVTDIADLAYAWGWAFALALQVFLGWVGWSVRKRFASTDQLTELGEALRKEIDDGIATLRNRDDNVETRVQRLEIEIKHMPDKAAMHELEVSLNRVEERLGGFDRLMTRLERIADRQEEYLLTQGGDR